MVLMISLIQNTPISNSDLPQMTTPWYKKFFKKIKTLVIPDPELISQMNIHNTTKLKDDNKISEIPKKNKKNSGTEAAMILLEEGDFGTASLSIEPKQDSLKDRTQKVFEKLKKELDSKPKDFEGVFEDDGSVEDLKDLRVGHLNTRKFEKEEFERLRANAQLRKAELRRIKPNLSEIDYISMGEAPLRRERILKGKGEVYNEGYDLHDEGRWSRVGITKHNKIIKEKEKSKHSFTRGQSNPGDKKNNSDSPNPRKAIDLAKYIKNMHEKDKNKKNEEKQEKLFQELNDLEQKKKELTVGMSGFDDNFTTNKARKFGTNMIYVDKKGKTHESHFPENDVNNQVNPLHYLKISIILKNEDMEIHTLENMQDVAKKHVAERKLKFNCDKILSELRKEYTITKFEKMHRKIQEHQREVKEGNQKGLTHNEKERIKAQKQIALDKLETNDSVSYSNLNSSGATAGAAHSTMKTNFSNFTGFADNSAEGFVNEADLDYRSNQINQKDDEDGSITSEEIKNIQKQKIEHAPVAKETELNPENIKALNQDFIEKKAEIFRTIASKKEADEFDNILHENEIGNTSEILNRFEKTPELDDKSNELDKFLLSGDDENDSGSVADFDSNKAQFESERTRVSANQDDLLLAPVFSEDEIIKEGPISLTVPRITGDDDPYSENNSFRYYYDQEYIFSISVCELFITEVEAFQTNRYLNNFICQYFSSLIRDTQFIQFVEYAKMTMGMQLVKHFDKYQEEYTDIVNKHKRKFDSTSIQDLLTNFGQDLPSFLDDLMTLLEKIADEYTESWDQKYDEIIKPMILDGMNSFKKYGLKIETLEMLIVSTFFLQENDPVAYRTRIFSSLEYHKTLLSEAFGSDFFEFMPDMLRHGRRSICNYFDIYGANYYYSDCGALFQEIGVTNKLYSKCRAIYNSIFSIAEAIPGFCSKMPQVKNFVDDIFMKISKQLGKNLYLYNKINIEFISDNLFNYMLDRYHEVTSLLEMYKHFTSTRTRFSQQIMTYLFPLFYRLRFNFQRDAMFEYKIQVLDQNIEKYLTKIKKFRFPFSKPVARIMEHIFTEINKKELSSRLGNKLKNYRFRESASFFCVVSTKIYMATLCDLIYEKMTFPFLYKFYKYDFVFEYLSSFLLDYSTEFDMYNNDQKKIVAHFKIEMKNKMQEIRNDLINSLYLFWPQLLDKVPRDALILILIYAKNLELDLGECLKETIMVWINVFLEKNIDQLTMPGFRVEYDMVEFFWDLSIVVLEKQKFENVMRLDKVVFYFFKQLTDFSNYTKNELLTNMGNLYSHFDNWDSKMEEYIYKYKQTNTKALMIDCKQDHDGQETECIENDSDAPFVASGCPEFSMKSENGLCITECPAGFVEHGMFCKKPEVILKKLMKSASECDANLGCVRLTDTLFIEECPKMFKSSSLLCFPKCPYGMSDEGNYCKKSIISRVTTYY